jgi:hypothetical protein
VLLVVVVWVVWAPQGALVGRGKDKDSNAQRTDTQANSHEEGAEGWMHRIPPARETALSGIPLVTALCSATVYSNHRAFC